MSQSKKSQPAQPNGGMKPSSSLPATGLGGNVLTGGSLGSTTPTAGLYGASGTHGVPSSKGGGRPNAGGGMKPGQKPGGKPTGVPRRTAG